MTAGLADSDWQTVLRLVIEPFKRLGYRVFLFGSRATGAHRNFSDLDILIEGRQPVPLSLLASVRGELEDSGLPITVDVVDVREIAESFRNEVLTTRIEV